MESGKLGLICAHIDGRGAGAGKINEARLAAQVGEDCGGNSLVIPAIDGWRSGLQAQVKHLGIDEPRVAIKVAEAAVAAPYSTAHRRDRPGYGEAESLPKTVILKTSYLLTGVKYTHTASATRYEQGGERKKCISGSIKL
jgi:hypothetical protein